MLVELTLRVRSFFAFKKAPDFVINYLYMTILVTLFLTARWVVSCAFAT